MFGFDVEKVQGQKLGSKYQLLAAHVCVVSISKDDSVNVAMNRYVKRSWNEVTDLMTRYSRVTWKNLESSDDMSDVRKDFLSLVKGNVLVAFDGDMDLKSMGLMPYDLREANCERVELQHYFEAESGKYGLGPLVEYFG